MQHYTATQLASNRAHKERLARLHPVLPPRISLSAKILRIEPEISPELLVWPSRDMVDHAPAAIRRIVNAQPVEPPAPARPTIGNIQAVTGRYFGIPLEDINSQRRHASSVRARMVAMYLCRQLTTWTSPEIGRAFGGRDHTTVLSAIKKIKRLIAVDERLAADVRAIEAMLGAGV